MGSGGWWEAVAGSVGRAASSRNRWEAVAGSRGMQQEPENGRGGGKVTNVPTERLVDSVFGRKHLLVWFGTEPALIPSHY